MVNNYSMSDVDGAIHRHIRGTLIKHGCLNPRSASTLSESSVKIAGKGSNGHKATSTERMSGTKQQNVSTVANGRKKTEEE